MANVSVFDMQGKEVGKMDLNDAVFGVEINPPCAFSARGAAESRRSTHSCRR